MAPTSGKLCGAKETPSTITLAPTSCAIAVIAVASLTFTASPAFACSPIPRFSIDSALLADGSFNQPGSVFLTEYAEWEAGIGFEPDQLADLIGVYKVETVATLEPDGTWTRGSVFAITDYWGEQPQSLRPYETGTGDTADGVDSCGYPFDGPEVGYTTYRLVTDTSVFDLLVDDPDLEANLTSGFGAPTEVDRNTAAEDALIVSLADQRGDDVADELVRLARPASPASQETESDGPLGFGTATTIIVVALLATAIGAAVWQRTMSSLHRPGSSRR